MAETKTLKTTINISGLHCASCKSLIEDVAGDINGVTSCIVDVDKGTAVVEYSEDLDLDALKKEIESLGKYKVTIK